MTPERLAEIERTCLQPVAVELLEYIRDLEAQVRALTTCPDCDHRTELHCESRIVGCQDISEAICGCRTLRSEILAATATPPSLSAKERQRRSFAYGNVHIDNPNVTLEMVDRAAERLASEPPSPEVGE